MNVPPITTTTFTDTDPSNLIPDKSNLRSEIKRIAKSILTSPLFWVCVATTTLTITAIILVGPLAGIGVVSIAAIGIGILLYNDSWINQKAYNRHNWFVDNVIRRLLHELNLTVILAGTKVNKITGYYNPRTSEITKFVTVGSLPLHTKRVRDSGYQAVLSMTEPHENKFFWFHVTEEDWKREKINYKNLPWPDKSTLSLNCMDAAADFIHEQASKKKKTFVHCKAGVGRSATAIAAYLIKHENMSPSNAKNLLESKRHVDISLNQLETFQKEKTAHGD